MTGRILVCGPVSVGSSLVADKLRDAYFQVSTNPRGFDPDDPVQWDGFDAAVCAGPLPVTGNRFGTGASFPIVLGYERCDLSVYSDCLASGIADAFGLETPPGILISRLRSLLRMKAIADDLEVRELSSTGFAPTAHHGQRSGFVAKPRIAVDDYLGDQLIRLPSSPVYNGGHVFSAMSTDHMPHVAVLNGHSASSEDILRRVAELRADTNMRHSSIIVVFGKGDHETALKAFDLGANDVVLGLGDGAELAFRIASHAQRRASIETQKLYIEADLKLAAIDPLTGLFNRRYLLRHLPVLLNKSASSGQKFSLAFADIDHFKSINDRFGHVAGDQVLRKVATKISRLVRSSDLVARVGGEEFIVVMPDTPLARARAISKRICREIAEEQIAMPGGEVRPLPTLSIGVTEIGDQSMTPDQIVAHADKALYRAKDLGRNTVHSQFVAA